MLTLSAQVSVLPLRKYLLNAYYGWMKRLLVVLSLISSLLVPIASTANANEKCLASFPDSDWINGTPAGVKSLLGFDLVEKIDRTPKVDSRIHPYFSLGDHTNTTTYSYVGKNCLSRDVRVSKEVSAKSVIFEFQTFDEYIKKYSRDFVQQENSYKYYSSIKDYFSSKVFTLNSKQLTSTEASGALGLFQVLRTMKKDLMLVPPRNTFVYFPTKCAFQKVLDSEGNETNERMFAFFVGGQIPPNRVVLNFQNEGECNGVLMEGGFDAANRASGVAEKIADIKYVVKSKPLTTSITCAKGKLVKSITGANPRCPAGYKVKK